MISCIFFTNPRVSDTYLKRIISCSCHAGFSIIYRFQIRTYRHSIQYYIIKVLPRTSTKYKFIRTTSTTSCQLSTSIRIRISFFCDGLTSRFLDSKKYADIKCNITNSLSSFTWNMYWISYTSWWSSLFDFISLFFLSFSAVLLSFLIPVEKWLVNSWIFRTSFQENIFSVFKIGFLCTCSRGSSIER